MKITIAGSGTSHGLPVAACKCKVCTSSDPHDTRYRASAFISDETTNIVIDTGPEFRLQSIRYNIETLDAILITHPHADHIHGLDDIRVYSKKKTIPVYCDKYALKNIKQSFSYIFHKTQIGGGKPNLELIKAEKFSKENPIEIGSMKIIPIPMMHGNQPSTGWRINNFAYLTDLNYLPEKSLKLLDGITHLVIDGLRTKPHSTHFTFAQALDTAEKTTAENIFLTHICHDYSHEEIIQILLEEKEKRPNLKNKIVKPAFDGLTLFS